MKKTFAFVNLGIDAGDYTGVDHGIAYLVPILKRRGYEVICVSISTKAEAPAAMERVLAIEPTVIGFRCTSHQIPYAQQLSALLKDHSSALQIAGGSGATLEPERLLAEGEIEGVCVGEGEIPLERLLDNMEAGRDIHETDGFYWLVGGEVRKNRPGDFVTDLTTLEYPDYGVFPPDVVCRDDSLYVLLSRGCPYSCHYCCNAALRDVYQDKKGYLCRVPPVGYAIEYLRHLLDLYPGTNYIRFEDDLLPADRKWFIEFLEAYQREIAKPYRLMMRVECIKPDVVDALQRSGCHRVFIGVESGSERIRREVLNKPFSNEMLLERCKMIQDAGLKILSLNMIGFPFETAEDMKATLEVNMQIQPDVGVCTFFYPYAGTELYRICRDNGLLKDEKELQEITNYQTRPAIRMDPELEMICINYRRRILEYFQRTAVAI